MIVAVIKGLVGFFCATALFWAGIAYEHRPAGQFSFEAWKWGPICVCYKDRGGPFAQLASLRAQEAAAGASAARLVAEQRKVSEAASGREIAMQGAIAWRTRTIVKEIAVAIPPAADRSFPLSVGFVRLHDAAARGVDLSDVAAPAGQPDDAASLVKPSDAAGAIAANYGACHADAEQLAALEAWLAAITR